MNLKDKIKTAAIVVSTAILTSCGLKNNNANQEKPNERNKNTPAMGFQEAKDAQLEEAIKAGDVVMLSGTITEENDTIWEINVPNTAEKSIKSRTASEEITNKLHESGISITKEDSILNDVDINYDKDGIALSNPRYKKNEVVEQNVEYSGDARIEHSPYKTELDSSSIGVKGFGKREITETESRSLLDRVKLRREKVVKDAEVEKNLQKGDKVKVEKEVGIDFLGCPEYETKTYTVRKDGVSPTETNLEILPKEEKRTKTVETVTFDYTKKGRQSDR